MDEYCKPALYSAICMKSPASAFEELLNEKLQALIDLCAGSALPILLNGGTLAASTLSYFSDFYIW